MKIIGGFKQFILRGNAIDLAVGVIVGASFSSVVTALVKDILTPFIGVIAKVPDLSSLSFTLRGSTFLYGDFLNVVISFLLSATAIYFFIVLPINALNNRAKKNSTPATPSIKKCPECLSEVPINATRCAHCTIKFT